MDETTSGSCSRCGGPLSADGRIVNDPHYRGAIGHSRSDWCYDCHLAAWHDRPTPIERFQFALMGGNTALFAAKYAGISHRMAAYWLRRWRENKDEFLENFDRNDLANQIIFDEIGESGNFHCTKTPPQSRRDYRGA